MSETPEKFTLPAEVVETIDAEARLQGVSRPAMLHQLICRALMGSGHLYDHRKADGRAIPRRPYAPGYNERHSDLTANRWTILLQLTPEDYGRLEDLAGPTGDTPEDVAQALLEFALDDHHAEVSTDG